MFKSHFAFLGGLGVLAVKIVFAFDSFEKE
jgi:hypothetical protein